MWMRCTGSLLRVFLRVICTHCYEMRVSYVGPGRSAVHGVSFVCVFTCNLHTLLRNACVLRGSRKERGARGLFCICFSCNLHTLLRNACILRGSQKERGSRGLFCICSYVQFAHVATKYIYFTWVPEGARCMGCTLGDLLESRRYFMVHLLAWSK